MSVVKEQHSRVTHEATDKFLGYVSLLSRNYKLGEPLLFLVMLNELLLGVMKAHCEVEDVRL